MLAQLKPRLSQTTIYKTSGVLIILVWLINGLWCKVLNRVPRHMEIVAQILNDDHARLLTVLIGMSEIIMAIWIVSGIKPKFNAGIQILVVAIMNTIEFVLVPDLLLWGRYNALFAALFIALVYYRAFVMNIPRTVQVIK